MAIINLLRGVEAGTYRLRIVSLEETFGPSGFPYMTLQLEIIRGEGKGLTFSDMLSLSPKARFRVEQFLDGIGAPKKGKVDSSWFVGKKAWGEVGIDTPRDTSRDTSRDTPRPRVIKWLPPIQDPDEAELAELALEDEGVEADIEEEFGEIDELSGEEEDDEDPLK